MSTTAASDSATDALVERLFMAAIGTLELASVHVGGRLGFIAPSRSGAMRRRVSWPLVPMPTSAMCVSGSKSRPLPAS
jgi:hypothetical protein